MSLSLIYFIGVLVGIVMLAISLKPRSFKMGMSLMLLGALMVFVCMGLLATERSNEYHRQINDPTKYRKEILTNTVITTNYIKL